MCDVVKNLQNIKSKINNDNVNIIAISKTFTIDQIKPLLDFGHIHFGENKVQEAKIKWLNIRHKNPRIKLHMVGGLQTNKAKEAVKLFDYIHSVSNKKLAQALVKYESLHNKKNKYFIQVNMGNEKQKSGVHIDELNELYAFCKKISLNIIGLMCIPPNDNNSKKYFLELSRLSNFLKLEQMSMGMSGDFFEAVQCGSTFVRIGTAIFSKRINK